MAAKKHKSHNNQPKRLLVSKSVTVMQKAGDGKQPQSADPANQKIGRREYACPLKSILALFVTSRIALTLIGIFSQFVLEPLIKGHQASEISSVKFLNVWAA